MRVAYRFSLSDIAIAVFAIILVSTFSLQLHLNRSLSPKVLAETYQILCGTTVMPPGTIILCTPGQMTTRGADKYICNSTCTGWVFVAPDSPSWDRGSCCVDDGIESICSDRYTMITCKGGDLVNGLPAGVKWFDSHNECYNVRAQSGGKCILSSSSSSNSSAAKFGGSTCGDYRVDTPNGYGVYEECDWGPRNSDTLPDSCRGNCMNPRCGDGVIDPSLLEECDDGDLGNGPNGWNNCDAECKVVTQAADESLYFMITQALMNLPSYEDLSNMGATSSTGENNGASAPLFDWNALFFPISPLTW